LELLSYLDNNFITLHELLNLAKVTEADFRTYQNEGVMPKASYVLDVNLKSDSFFGLHHESQQIEYYAKGYLSWLGLLGSMCKSSIYKEFCSRYKGAIKNLNSLGHNSSSVKFTEKLDGHIEAEWGHFIQGVYGLCTVSGLPEDIAAKELAITQINELDVETSLSEEAVEKLIRAVNLLDKVSSDFAPHERLKSSRHRLVNMVRLKYQLQA